MRISPKEGKVACFTLEKAAEAVEILKYIPRKAARMFDKTLKSAMANAENNSNLSARRSIYIWEAIVDEGQHLSVSTLC